MIKKVHQRASKTFRLDDFGFQTRLPLRGQAVPVVVLGLTPQAEGSSYRYGTQHAMAVYGLGDMVRYVVLLEQTVAEAIY